MPPVSCCHVLLQPLAKNVSSGTASSVWATDVPGWITAVGTALLAVFAILTTIYAVRAFRKQSQEVSDQASMLQVQSEQLAEQRKVNAEQIRVLGLQAAELGESLGERKWEAEQRRSAQAARVFVSQASRVFVAHDPSEVSEMLDEDEDSWTDITKAEAEAEGGWSVAELTVVNTSDQPVYDTQLRWHRGSASHGWPPMEYLGTIMPGSEEKRIRRFPLDTNMAVSGAIFMFRDAAGVKWIRRPDGGLVEQQ